MPVDPNIAGLLSLIAAAGRPPMHEASVEDARLGFRTLMVTFRDPSTLVDVASVTDASIAAAGPVRIYRPHADAPTPTILYFHGGGFVIGDLDTHENVCRRLCADTGAVVVSVDYPLAPEHPFPAAVDAAVGALEWVVEHVHDLGADATRVAVAGDSAGGNLAAGCAQYAAAHGIALAGQLLVFPPTDLANDYPSRTENGEGYFMSRADMYWFAENYLGMAEDDPRAAALVRDPRLSPLLADSHDGLAPTVIVTAEYDPLRDEGDAYAEALDKAGVPVVHRQFAGLVHGFYGMEGFSPAAAEATAWTHAQFKELIG